MTNTFELIHSEQGVSQFNATAGVLPCENDNYAHIAEKWIP